MASVDFSTINILAIKDIIDFYFQNVEDIWDDITRSKENDKPEDYAYEWILVEGQLQLIKGTLQELNQEAAIPMVEPKNLEYVVETLRLYFKANIYPDELAQDEHLRETWLLLHQQMRTLRIYLLEIYHEIEH